MISEDYFPTSQSLGVRLFYFITYPLRILSCFTVEIFIMFQIAIFIVSLLFFWKAFEVVLRYYGKTKDLNKSFKIYLLLSLFYPSYLLFIPITLREFLILFGFSILVYGLVKFYYFRKGFLLLLMGSLILIFARPQLIVISIIFFVIFQNNKYIKYLLLPFLILIIPFAFTSLTGYTFSPEFFAYLRNSANDNYADSGMVYGLVDWHSYIDILIDLPLLFLQFVLSPLPILHSINPFSLFAIFVDSVFCLIIYFLVFKVDLKLSKVFLIIFILSSAIFSIWEFYIGGAVRHRMPLVATLLPVASYGFVIILNKFRKKNDIQNTNINNR
jgi:hypothetical protein